jgi:hypothetical protein
MMATGLKLEDICNSLIQYNRSHNPPKGRAMVAMAIRLFEACITQVDDIPYDSFRHNGGRMTCRVRGESLDKLPNLAQETKR